VRTQNFSHWGGGGGFADPETIYNLCFISNSTLQNLRRKYNCNITRFATAFKHIQIELHIPRLSHSVLSPCLFKFINLFFEIPMYYSSADFTGGSG